MSNQDFNPEAGSPDITQGLPGSDEITETSSRSWFQRIGDSIKAILFGLIFVIASGVLLFWNEGRTAKTAAALAEGAGLVISVDPARVDASHDGQLVHVAGETSAARAAADPDFGFDTRGLRLVRKVEMYQWKEEKRTETQKKLGGGEETITRYSYTHEWSDKAIDSSRFRNSSDHRNPPMPNIASRAFNAPDVKLGAFALNERVLGLLGDGEAFSVPDTVTAKARERLGPRARVAQGGVYAGANPDQPATGDVRVTWKVLSLTAVSVVGSQKSSGISPWAAKNGNEVLLAETGVKEASILFKHGQEENRLIAWLLRAIGVLFMFVGFRMMLSLLEVLADIVPFIGNIVGAGASLVALICTAVLAPVIIAIAWMFYRPVVAIGALAAGAALVWFLRRMAHGRIAARAPALAPVAAPAGGGSFLANAPLARNPLDRGGRM